MRRRIGFLVLIFVFLGQSVFSAYAIPSYVDYVMSKPPEERAAAAREWQAMFIAEQQAAAEEQEEEDTPSDDSQPPDNAEDGNNPDSVGGAEDIQVFYENGIKYENIDGEIYKDGRLIPPSSYQYIPSAIGGTRDDQPADSESNNDDGSGSAPDSDFVYYEGDIKYERIDGEIYKNGVLVPVDHYQYIPEVVGGTRNVDITVVGSTIIDNGDGTTTIVTVATETIEFADMSTAQKQELLADMVLAGTIETSNVNGLALNNAVYLTRGYVVYGSSLSASKDSGAVKYYDADTGEYRFLGEDVNGNLFLNPEFPYDYQTSLAEFDKGWVDPLGVDNDVLRQLIGEDVLRNWDDFSSEDKLATAEQFLIQNPDWVEAGWTAEEIEAQFLFRQVTDDSGITQGVFTGVFESVNGGYRYDNFTVSPTPLTITDVTTETTIVPTPSGGGQAVSDPPQSTGGSSGTNDNDPSDDGGDNDGTDEESDNPPGNHSNSKKWIEAQITVDYQCQGVVFYSEMITKTFLKNSGLVVGVPARNFYPLYQLNDVTSKSISLSKHNKEVQVSFNYEECASISSQLTYQVESPKMRSDNTIAAGYGLGCTLMWQVNTPYATSLLQGNPYGDLIWLEQVPYQWWYGEAPYRVDPIYPFEFVSGTIANSSWELAINTDSGSNQSRVFYTPIELLDGPYPVTLQFGGILYPEWTINGAGDVVISSYQELTISEQFLITIDGSMINDARVVSGKLQR